MTHVESSSFFMTQTGRMQPEDMQFYQDWLHRLPPSSEPLSADTLEAIDPMVFVEACAIAQPLEDSFQVSLPMYNPSQSAPERIELTLSPIQFYLLDRSCRQELVATNRLTFMYLQKNMIQYPDLRLSINNTVMKNGLIHFPVGKERITIGYNDEESSCLASYKKTSDVITFTANFMRRYWQQHESQVMTPDTLTRWLTQHELTHRQWGMVSPEDRASIINQFSQLNPTIQTFLDIFMDKSAYRVHAIPAGDQLEDNVSISDFYLTKYQGESYRVKRCIVVDELVAQASWADVLSQEELDSHAVSEPREETYKTVRMGLAAKACLDESPWKCQMLHKYGLLGRDKEDFETSVQAMHTAIQILGREEGYGVPLEGKIAVIRALFPSV